MYYVLNLVNNAAGARNVIYNVSTGILSICSNFGDPNTPFTIGMTFSLAMSPTFYFNLLLYLFI